MAHGSAFLASCASGQSPPEPSVANDTNTLVPSVSGGMATAIREPVILQRTLTIHGDVDRVTRPLGIETGR